MSGGTGIFPRRGGFGLPGRYAEMSGRMLRRGLIANFAPEPSTSPPRGTTHPRKTPTNQLTTARSPLEASARIWHRQPIAATEGRNPLSRCHASQTTHPLVRGSFQGEIRNSVYACAGRADGYRTVGIANADALGTMAVTWGFTGWQVLGSNQRRLSRRFYRPLPLATRATCREPPSWDGTLKDSGTFAVRQHPGV